MRVCPSDSYKYVTFKMTQFNVTVWKADLACDTKIYMYKSKIESLWYLDKDLDQSQEREIL